MLAGNLRNFFSGGTRAREFRKLQSDWEYAQSVWRSSPLAELDLSELAVALVRKALVQVERRPATPILIAICEAVEGLYSAEEICAVDANWEVLEHSAEAALEFQDMMARRTRWATGFDHMNNAFEDTVLSAIAEFIGALPEYCLDDWEAGGEFELPIIDLLGDPALAVDKLFMLPYADASFRYDLFKRLRELCATNLLIASGFRGDENIRDVEHKLKRPPDQKTQIGVELADLYLRGSPLRKLLDVPAPFHIPDESRFEHCHVIGGTGHGKTQLLQKMIHTDLLASKEDQRSVIVIDSQGDLINKLVRLDLFSPSAEESLANRLVLIDPADVEHPAALNLFDAHLDRVRDYSAADRERVLNGVIELYELFFGAFLGAELTQKQGVIFRYLARLMLAIPGATIHTLIKVMENGRDFQKYIDTLDGSARYFFETEFFTPSFAPTKKQVLRRLWGVLSTPAFERMFTQPKNKLDLFEAMNEGKIILVSTAKDLLKQEGSQILGRFVIAMVTQAALERSTIHESERRAVFVYVDEAQEYFDDSIETILTQARKYRVGLTLAHQTLDQLSPRLRSAMLANTSVKCVGGVSAKDARALADELHTSSDFIESMKRRKDRTEFAVWVKNLTGQAVRVNCPLGFLERQPTLDAEEFEELTEANRNRYGGVPQKLIWTPAEDYAGKSAPKVRESQSSLKERNRSQSERISQAPEPAFAEAPSIVQASPTHPKAQKTAATDEAPNELGKGGRNHRYLQSLIRELADQHGIRATIEAPLPGGGQVDVLLERDEVLAAVEISVSTPVAHEIQNIRKCLDAGHQRVGVVLAKSKKAQKNYIATINASLSESARSRVSLLVPEDLPDFIAGLTPSTRREERIVRGYKVRTSVREGSLEEAKARRELVAKLVSKSISPDIS